MIAYLYHKNFQNMSYSGCREILSRREWITDRSHSLTQLKISEKNYLRSILCGQWFSVFVRKWCWSIVFRVFFARGGEKIHQKKVLIVFKRILVINIKHKKPRKICRVTANFPAEDSFLFVTKKKVFFCFVCDSLFAKK